jgi:hypothetical protein
MSQSDSRLGKRQLESLRPDSCSHTNLRIGLFNPSVSNDEKVKEDSDVRSNEEGKNQGDRILGPAQTI